MDLRTSEPFWLVKNGLLHSYPSLRKDIKTDILIVGAGITGALMAHKCREEGYQSVVIDRREVANGSTSATTSMLQYEIDVPLYELSELIGKKGAEANYWAGHAAIDEMDDIVQKVQSKCGFEKKESLFYAAFKKDVLALQNEFEARKSCGINVKWLSAEEIEEKYQLKGSFGGILSQQGASIDAFRLTHDIFAYHHQKGLQIFDKTRIKSTDYLTDIVLVTTEYGNTITAKKVIYCTGYESTEMFKEKLVNLLSTYAIVGECNEERPSLLNTTLFWDTAQPYIYMRTTADHRLLIGGEDEEFITKNKRDAVLSTKAKKLEEIVQKMLPNYKFRMDYSWAGMFGETKDGLPYIGEHPDFKNSYFLLGFGGNGITFSVIGTNVISHMLKDQQHPLATYYRFGR